MNNPHLSSPVVFRALGNMEVSAAVILLHGRRQTINEIYRCAERIELSYLLYTMPSADQLTWYPRAFMRPIEDNEPRFSHALAAVDKTVQTLIERGFTRDRIVLMGFSQGACLACEYIYRNPDRWGGLIAFTGGLFGPSGTTWTAMASFRQTPVYLGIGDPDEWIPAKRVKETAEAFRAAGAEVLERIYPNIGHSICDEEIIDARKILMGLLTVKCGISTV